MTTGLQGDVELYVYRCIVVYDAVAGKGVSASASIQQVGLSLGGNQSRAERLAYDITHTGWLAETIIAKAR